MGSVGVMNTNWACSPFLGETTNVLRRFSLDFTGSYAKFRGSEQKAMHKDVSESRGVRKTRRRVTLHTRCNMRIC